VAEFTMPSLGADMDSGTLVEWLVSPGDTVHRGDPIAVVDTDKAAIEVESFADGVVESFLVEPGTRVAVGTPLARLASAGAAATTVIPAPRAPQPPARIGAPPLRHHAAELGVDLTKVVGSGPHGEVTRGDVDRAAAVAKAERRTVKPAAAPAKMRVSPYARRLAHELGVDLAEIPGTGPDGVVRAEQVRAAAAKAPTPTRKAKPAAPEQKPAAPERKAEAGASRATIAALMSRAKREIPHYYVATTADLSVLTEWLRRTNRDRPVSGRIVPAAAILKATAMAAREHPELNGFWVDGGFVPGDDVHLGVAVHVRGGALVAPAIHHTADLDLPAVMAALRDLVSRARAGRLRRTELADPTLTVTDLGDQGVEEVIGVIYPPQVALLGVGRVIERPWAVDAMIGVRPTVRLTLSGDHRATDGASGARFLNTLERLLQHPEDL
jgi:pyruvate dehydrogenase E2 component (dihydrolipoamide acetyltransferase)